MTRKFSDKELIVATHNQGKLAEIKDYLGNYLETLYSANDLELDDPEETEDTFEGNAMLKALAAAKATGRIALADDSGFAVDVLGGAPGIYSARWAEQEDGTRNFEQAMIDVNEQTKDQDNKNAKFVCVIALAWPDGHCETARGEITGQIIWPPRGDKGFGYDPMFMPDGTTQTFAEISPDEKRADSHRTRAIKGIVEKCFKTA